MISTAAIGGVRLYRQLHIACEAETWNEMERRLRSEFPKEACCFVITRRSKGIRRLSVLLRELMWPEPGDVTATKYSLEISANYISRALDALNDAGPFAGIALIHTHPPGVGGELMQIRPPLSLASLSAQKL